MTATPPTASSSPSAVAGLGALLTVLAFGAMAGIFLAAQLLSSADAHEGHAANLPAGPFAVADDVPTSFGFVAVEHAETLKGLTAKQLGGATHGIGGFVGRDKALVQASVTITNTGEDALPYSPKQFRIVSRSGKRGARRIPMAHSTVRAGTLQPDAAIDARLSFVVPRDGSRLEVEFDDPGRKSPVRILLGNRAGRLTAMDRKALAEGHAAAKSPASGAAEGHDHSSHDHTGGGH
jgi:hypothetical protein